jgi:two-component system cell cycle response regulator DivK
MAKRVLICDDDTDILSICTYILEKQGFEVTTSTHCNNILDIVKEAQPNVILMDNWIPDAGGIVASQTIKEQEEYRKIPIVYFSANNDIKALAEKAGADAFLAKPFDLEDLEKIIKKIVQ